MQKYIQLIFILFIVASIAACGGSGTTTTAVPIYDSPAALAPASTHMGGSVQETPLVLSNTVSTLAGSPEISVLTDGSGTAARFNRPTDITTDGTNFYVADYANNAIRKVSKSGDVTTLQCTDANTGFIGFHQPFSLTISPDGTHLYVVDAGSNTIRVVDLVTADTTKNVTTIGSTTGLAGSVDSVVKTDVRFNRPTGITTDGDNLYVTDSGNHTIRRIVIATGAVSTLAGTPGIIGSTDGGPRVALFNLPQRITTDGASLYVTDFNNQTIRMIDILTGKVSTLAGSTGVLDLNTSRTDGIGSAARFYQPNGITTDGTNLYVIDSYWNTIRKIVIATRDVTTIPISASILHTPTGITTDGVSLFVADTYTVTRDPKTMIDTYTYSNSIIRID